MSNVYVASDTVIGKNVTIESGARIGVRGLALERYGENSEKFRMKKYLGKVVLHDKVHIGANTCVERGLTGDTIIGEGSKIDLLCCIGHDVVIGKNCRITPLCNILGYAQIGNNVFIGGSTAVRNRIRIGDNAWIGMGSLIVKDVEPLTFIFGHPPNMTARKIEPRSSSNDNE